MFCMAIFFMEVCTQFASDTWYISIYLWYLFAIALHNKQKKPFYGSFRMCFGTDNGTERVLVEWIFIIYLYIFYYSVNGHSLKVSIPRYLNSNTLWLVERTVKRNAHTLKSFKNILFQFFICTRIFYQKKYFNLYLQQKKNKAHGVNLCCKCVIWRTNFDTC